MTIDYNLTEKRLTSSDGTIIYAVAAGNPANNAIVFVHGFALTAAVWDGILKDERLLKEFYLVAYDLRGNGRSGKPADPAGHESSLYAADFDAVLKGFNLNRPIVVPWSLGGIIGTDICAHLPPQTLSGIIYLNAVPHTGPIIVETGSPKIMSELPDMLSTTDTTAAAEAKIKFVDACFSKPEETPARLKWEWLGMVAVQPPVVAALTTSREQDADKLYEAVANGLPVSMISSTTDRVIMTAIVEKILKGRFKKFPVRHIENGSHAPFIDQKEEFVDALLELSRATFAEKAGN